MAWPDDEILEIKVEAGGLTDGSTWTDITEYVYKETVKISRGTAEEANQAAPSSCSFLLNNLDGRFSPRNPTGPHYGNFRRNTPLLVSVMGGEKYLDVPAAGRARVLDTAQIDITGDIDVRFDATLYNWNMSAPGQQLELIAKYDVTGNQRSWALMVFDGALVYRWSADGSSFTQVGTEDDRITVPSNDRLAVRVTHDVDDGSGNNVVTFYTAPTIEGPWAQLGQPVTTAGTTSIFNSTAQLAVGDALEDVGFTPPQGKIWAAQVYNGIGGTIAADVDFRVQTVGDTSFVDDAGLTWDTESGAHINNQQNRFRGEVIAWPSKWETGGRDVWVPIQAKGLLRRHNQGTKPLQSAMRRAIPADPDLIAYWPLEDGENATLFGAATPNTRAMTFTGDVSPAAHAGPEGSDSLPSFSEGSSWYAPVPAPASAAGEYQVEWLVNIQQVTATLRTIMYIQTTGGIISWRFLVDQDTVGVRGYMRDGTVLVSQDLAVNVSPDFLNTWWRWQFRVVPNGGGLDWTLTFWQVGESGGTFTQTGVAAGVGRVSAISGVDSLSADIAGLSWGHLAVFNTGESNIFDLSDDGYAGESAVDRFERLAEESGENVITCGSRTDNVVDMGAQRPDKLVDLLSETAYADRGILLDTRDVADYTGFKWIGKSALYNQPVTLELDYDGSDGLITPMDPVDDDLYLRNAVTANRERGASSYVELEEGELTPANVGLYDHSVEVNISSDDRLIHRAGWELHLGTWNEERYPSVNMLLQAAPHKIPDVLNLDVGSRIRIKNARTAGSTDNDWIPPGDIELIIVGYREVLAQYQWEFEFQCVPARAWDINVLDSLANRTNRIDTDACELAEALDSTETAVEVFTTDGPTWTDEVENMPFDWTVGGEVMTVMAPGSLVNDNALFDSNITGWTASGCTAVHSTDVVHPDPIALGAAKITPDGVTASGGISLTTRTAAGTITPVASYKAACWVYAEVAHTDVRTAIDFYDSANSFISSALGSASSVPAKTWTYLEQTLAAPALASRASVRFRFGSTPASTKIFYVWDLTISRIKASLVYDQFGRTETDTWGLADSSQTWTNSGGAAADYDVIAAYGRHINPATSTGHHSVIANTEADSDFYVDITTAAASTGASQLAGALARYTDANNLYEARLEMTTANVLTLSIRKRVASVETQLGTFTHWQAHAALTYVRVRFQVIGTALKAKAWRVGDPEPDVWQISVTDSDLAGPGSVGVKSVRAAGNTNANAEFRFDNLELANPQVYSVLRSRNGVVKSHSSGDDVVLTYPMILGL